MRRSPLSLTLPLLLTTACTREDLTTPELRREALLRLLDQTAVDLQRVFERHESASIAILVRAGRIAPGRTPRQNAVSQHVKALADRLRAGTFELQSPASGPRKPAHEQEVLLELGIHLQIARATLADQRVHAALGRTVGDDVQQRAAEHLERACTEALAVVERSARTFERIQAAASR